MISKKSRNKSQKKKKMSEKVCHPCHWLSFDFQDLNFIVPWFLQGQYTPKLWRKPLKLFIK